MFSTSNKLIENISNEFHINDEESNQIINKLFQKVTFSILNGNRFYMDKLGIISLNENKEILEYIYQTSNMGMESTKDLINSLKGKDNKIKKLVEEIEKNYEKYAKETQKLLNKKDLKAKPIGMMAKAMSKMSINKEMISDNSDSNIADMLIQGLTMGNLELSKHIDNYEKTADKKTINLAKSLRKFGEEYIEKLKVYL